MKTLILTFLALCTLAFLPNNEYTLTGKVVDDTGQPLLGAAVLLDGTSTGRVTDLSGNFSLPSPDSCHRVTISYTGFETQALEICAGWPVTVSMKAATQLDEIVVTSGSAPGNKRLRAQERARPTASEDIRSLPTRNINALAASPAGPATANQGNQMNVSGSRNDVTNYYVDGVRVQGNLIPETELTSDTRARRKLAPEPEPATGDHYAKIQENDFVTTAAETTSTFAIDVDAAGYSNTRRFLNEGRLPPADAVRSEEMINYFQYNYPYPTADQIPFAVTTELATCPWNPANQLLLIGLRAQEIPKADLPPANFVFLLDVSGSMNRPDALPLLVESMKLLTDNLRAEDKVAIVVYAGASGLVLESTSGADKPKIKEALTRLRAGGSTAGAAGIEQAYAVARENFIPGGNNRVILATDGDFNVGVSDNAGLETLIEQKRESGIFLSVLGFGRGNLQDDKMQLLADKGNGNHAYIDQIGEARKVLVSEFGGTLFTVAKDVKIQVEFNPAYVSSYRQIGYENRALANADFRNDAKDAGELGAGHTVTALYEITPAKTVAATDAAAVVRLRYKAPDGDAATERTYYVAGGRFSFGQSSNALRWAATVAEFAMLLRDSEHKGEATYEHCRQLGGQALGRDPFGYRKEMLDLIARAQELTPSSTPSLKAE